MTLSNLEWYGWILLAITLNSLLVDVVNAARWAIRADLATYQPSFGVTAIGIAIVLYLMLP